MIAHNVRFFLSSDMGPYCVVVILRVSAAALSTYLLTILVSLQEGHVMVFLLFLGMFALGSICGGWSEYLKDKLAVQSAERCLTTGADAVLGRPDIYTDREERERRSFALVGSGIEVVQGATGYFCDLFQVLTNAILMLAVVALLVDPLIIVSYGLSLGLILIVVFQTLKVAGKKAARYERRRITLGRIFAHLWDGYVLNNWKWKERWSRLFRFTLKQYSRAKLSSDSYGVIVQGVIFAVAHFPTFVVLAWIMAIQEREQILQVVVVVPRILQLLNSQSQIGAMLAGWGHVGGQLDVLETSLSPPEEQSLLPRIQWDKIALSRNSFSARELFERIISGGIRRGRYTLRGPNGSGKTSLLLQIQGQCRGHAHYMGPQCEGQYSLAADNESTGERASAMLKEALVSGDQVVLLDEWDANLDEDRRSTLDKLIDERSHEIAVIEVRHRRTATSK